MTTNLVIKKAEKKRSKLRLAIDGPSGSGKTWTSLVTAEALANGERVGVIDTEHGSASLYSDRFQFDVIELTSFDPALYVKAIHMFEAAGYAVIVIDSLSHAWEGDGGVLEIVDKKAKGGNTWAGWSAGTPAYRSLIAAILASPVHVISTMRTKTEWVTPEKGKAPVKIGTAPVMRAGVEYEMTVVADMDTDHVLTVSKSRCPAVADRVIRHPDGQFGRELLAWLNDGGDPVPPVWQVRFAEAIETLGGADAEIRVRTLMNGAEPSVLDNDAAWDRLQSLVANARGDQHAAASPDAGTGPPGVADEAGEATVDAVAPGPSAGETAGSPAGGAGAGGRPPTDGEAGVLDGQPAPVITQPQLRRLFAIASEHGIDDAAMKLIVQHIAGVEHRNEIPVDRYEAVEAALVEAGEHEAELRSLAGIPAAGEGA